MGSSSLYLHRGKVIISAKKLTTIETPYGKVQFSDADVLLCVDQGYLSVRVLSDKRLNSVFVNLNNHRIPVQVGQEVCWKKGFYEAQNDKIGRRDTKQASLAGGTLFTSDVSLLSVLATSDVLSHLRRSQTAQEVQLFQRILKSAACLSTVTNRKGSYKQMTLNEKMI